MRNVSGIIAGITLIAAASAMANPAGTHGAGNFVGTVGYYGQTAGASFGQGGQLTVAVYGKKFQTFCVERDEHIGYSGDALNGMISTANVDGSQPGSHAWLGGSNTNSGDDLDAKTAYLFTKFVQSGNGYWSNTYALTTAQLAGALQAAIWKIEGETDAVYTGLGLSANQANQANDWIAEAGNAKGIGNVRILQVYTALPDSTGQGGFRQDLLIMVPVPAAAILGVLGLGLVGWAKRRGA
jgi:hypothetical protein